MISSGSKVPWGVWNPQGGKWETNTGRNIILCIKASSFFPELQNVIFYNDEIFHIKFYPQEKRDTYNT